MMESHRSSASTAAPPLSGRHALVTGGSRGIGAAIAAELAGLGAALTLLGRDAAALERRRETLQAQFGAPIAAIAADVTHPASLAAAFDQATRSLGPPLILVNNAGAAESAPFARTTPDLWQRMIEVNLTGTFLACQAVVPAMAAAGWGRIVNVASTAGLVGYAYVAAYCAAKHGVIGLTRALATELAGRGITVNAVCPGYTEGEMTERTIATIVARTGRDAEAARAELVRHNPQGRLVRAEEVAAAVGWLVRPDSAAVTGQAIAVAGGEVMQ